MRRLARAAASVAARTALRQGMLTSQIGSLPPFRYAAAQATMNL